MTRPLRVAGWIGIVVGALAVATGLLFLTDAARGESDLAGLGVLAFVVYAALGAAGLGLGAAVLRLRSRRPGQAAALAVVLGLALFPIWSATLSVLAAPLPSWVGALQLPVPLVVLGLGIVTLVRLRRE